MVLSRGLRFGLNDKGEASMKNSMSPFTIKNHLVFHGIMANNFNPSI